MEDRFVVGGIAGLIGATTQNIYSYIIRSLNLAEYTYSDFATTILTGKVYTDSIGIVAGFIAYLAVGVILGIVFAYIIAGTSSRYLYIKGIFYGFVLWFLLTGFGTIFGLETFLDMSAISALSILGGGLIFGIVTAYSIKLLDHKTDYL